MTAVLRSLVVYDRRSQRVWICARRCHHGAVGAVLVAYGLASRSAAAIFLGTGLCYHDRRDARRWIGGV